jgi:Fe-Mn family superoxide dismutase
MNRKQFLTTSLLGSLTLTAGARETFEFNLDNGLDRLTDEQGNFIQLPLPYAFNNLEPQMDEETVNLHYTFHHGGAVKKANAALLKINDALSFGNFELSDTWTKKLTFQFSSHILHTIFWTNLTNKPNAPKGNLLAEIERSFGTFDRLKGLLSYVSKNVEGNGWGILGYQPYTRRLTVVQCENHEKLTQWGIIPLLVIDVWEHAYYLKFRNKRDAFVDNLFPIIDWDNVAMRLDAARQLER